MPLIQSKSKKAFKQNVETEMDSGKPKNQSLAIAYNVKRKSKKKMADGGVISVSNEKRPMPEQRNNDSKNVSQNSGKKPLMQSDWTGRPTVEQAQRPSKTPMSEPRMTESTIIKAHIIKNLIDSIAPDGGSSQPNKSYDEERPDRQGPDMKDLHMKRMKDGGMISGSSDMDESERHQGKSQVSMEMGDGPEEDRDPNMSPIRESYMRPNKDEYMSDRMADGGEIDETDEMNSRPDRGFGAIIVKAEGGDVEDESDIDHVIEDIKQLEPETKRIADKVRLAKGGSIEREMMMQPEEEQDEHQSSLAAAVMSRRKRMAEGGQVDLSRNADEDANLEDQLSFNALKKENYSESEGLDQLDQPEDSNEIGDDREEESENKNDRVSSIRRKMRIKNQFSR